MVVEGREGADVSPSYHNGTEKQWENSGKSRDGGGEKKKTRPLAGSRPGTGVLRRVRPPGCGTAVGGTAFAFRARTRGAGGRAAVQSLPT